jgi:hypothetical protein
MWRRLLVSLAIGAASTVLCWSFLHKFQLGGFDFNWALRSARDLVSGHNPYDYPFDKTIPYPLTAAILGLPFLWVKPELGGALFFGVSSALLALGLTRSGYTRLLIFLAYPYWAAMMTAQWSPLIVAGALFSWLLPVTMVKPQGGVPLFFTYVTRRGFIVCLIFGALSLAVMPSWPQQWLSQIRHYEYYVPLLVLPGPALLLSIWRRRDTDSHLLLLSSIMPQRWFYDSFILWLIPKERREILGTVLLSWGAGLWRWYYMPRSWDEVGFSVVLWIYVPMLAIVLLRGMELAKPSLVSKPASAGSPEVKEAFHSEHRWR